MTNVVPRGKQYAVNPRVAPSCWSLLCLTAVVAACALAADEPVKTYGDGVFASVVQDVPGYNSWPMIQAVGDRLVCVYSRGTAHLIGEGRRGGSNAARGADR